MQKLVQRGYEKSDILPVLDELAAEDWQSDQRFAESYARYRSLRGLGPERLVRELQEKGIEKQLINQIIKFDDGKWLEIAREAYFKKFGETCAEDFTEKMKRKKYMCYRGFTQQQFEAVEELSHEK